MTTMETSKFRTRYVWYKKRRHPYAALQNIIKKFCNKLMALGICLTRSGKRQLAEYMGKYHISSCANIECSTYFGLMILHLHVFLVFKLLLEVPSHLCGVFFHLCFCVRIHVQPLTMGFYQSTSSCGYTGKF